MVQGKTMEITVPEDKSISQRALILASLSEEESRISGLLSGGDPMGNPQALVADLVDKYNPPAGSGLNIKTGDDQRSGRGIVNAGDQV